MQAETEILTLEERLQPNSRSPSHELALCAVLFLALLVCPALPLPLYSPLLPLAPNLLQFLLCPVPSRQLNRETAPPNNSIRAGEFRRILGGSGRLSECQGGSEDGVARGSGRGREGREGGRGLEEGDATAELVGCVCGWSVQFYVCSRRDLPTLRSQRVECFVACAHVDPTGR